MFKQVSFLQPEVQAYPGESGSRTFPPKHGQATSISNADVGQVQQAFAYVPDDGSLTYVVNVEVSVPNLPAFFTYCTDPLSGQTNTTRSLPGPTAKDPRAVYTASASSLVQLTSQNQIWFTDLQTGRWSQIAAGTLVAPASAPSSSSVVPINPVPTAAPRPSSSGFMSAYSTPSAAASASVTPQVRNGAVHALASVGLLGLVGCTGMALISALLL